MAEPVEVNEVLQVTGLTPSTPAAPEPEPSAAPSEPEVEASEAQPAEEPAAAEEHEPEVEASTAQTPDAQPEAPKKPARGVQKALDRLTREREEARLQAAQYGGALQALIAQMQNNNQQQRPPQQPVAPVTDEPNRKDYPDWEQYNRAMAQHEARKAADQIVKQNLGQFVRALAGQQVYNQTQQEAASKVARLEAENAKAATRFQDWEEVRANDAPVPPSLYNAITESADPTLVIHHLHAHPEEYNKVVRMTPNQQLMAIGAIVASAAAPQRVSNAPAPARPVSAVRGSQGGSQYTENMTAEQHKAWVRRQGVDRGLK